MSVLSDYERETAPLPGRLQALSPRAYSDSEVFDLGQSLAAPFGLLGGKQLPDEVFVKIWLNLAQDMEGVAQLVGRRLVQPPSDE